MSLRFWQGGGESQTTLSPVMPNIFVGKKNSYMYRSVQKICYAHLRISHGYFWCWLRGDPVMDSDYIIMNQMLGADGPICYDSLSRQH